jgi:3-hydroxymyristoyl/3-hydroxydecanoyl-(acyl carrier protein) dehydratase
MVRGDEPCFTTLGSSPCSYPSVLVLESFGQACGLLRAATGAPGEPRVEGKVPVAAKLAGVRFVGEVAPGEELEHHVDLLVRTGEGAVFGGTTVVAGRPVMEVRRVVAALAPSPAGRATLQA